MRSLRALAQSALIVAAVVPNALQSQQFMPIEPEAVFGQMKQDKHYKRFRHFGKDKVTMDFAFFAIAFNIKKMAAKQIKQTM